MLKINLPERNEQPRADQGECSAVNAQPGPGAQGDANIGKGDDDKRDPEVHTGKCGARLSGMGLIKCQGRRE